MEPADNFVGNVLEQGALDLAFAQRVVCNTCTRRLIRACYKVVHNWERFLRLPEKQDLAMTGEAPSDYVLATGEAAAERLRLLNDIFGLGTHRLLRTAGLTPGMQAAEVGCGNGLISIWIAERVGSDGSVTAVDGSSEQLQVAKRNAESAQIRNVSFHHAGAYETGLPTESFDLVFSRFLMCHLAEPARALVEMRRLLKPGGVLVCEDHDDGGIFTEPPTRAYRRLVEISEAVNRAHGLDSYIGLKLPRLIQKAGFANPEVQVDQIAVLRGPAKRFWELTLREAGAAILAARASSPDELEAIYQEMQSIAEDDSILLMLARVTQVWARKQKVSNPEIAVCEEGRQGEP